MDKPFTYREAADYLGISYDAMRKLKERRSIPYMLIGSKVYFAKKDIDNLFTKIN